MSRRKKRRTGPRGIEATELRRLIAEMFERRPDFTDADVAWNLSKQTGVKVKESTVCYHRRIAEIPARRLRMKRIEHGKYKQGLAFVLADCRRHLAKDAPADLITRLDEMLGLFVKGYEPPPPPALKGSKMIDIVGTPEVRQLLSESLGKEVAGNFRYGFAIWEHIVITHTPLEEVSLKRQSTHLDAIDLLVGVPVKNVPLVRFDGIGLEYNVARDEEE